MKIEYKYGKKNIEAEVIYSDRETIDLRIFPEGNIQITVPKNTSMEKVIEKESLDALCESRSSIACMAMPRAQEIFACFDRYRKLKL